MTWTWSWLGIMLAIAAAVLLVGALVVMVGILMGGTGQRSVGAFTCHDCPMLYVTTAQPVRTVQSQLDDLSREHMGHRLASSLVDV